MPELCSTSSCRRLRAKVSSRRRNRRRVSPPADPRIPRVGRLASFRRRQDPRFPGSHALLPSFHRTLEHLHHVPDARIFWVLISRWLLVCPSCKYTSVFGIHRGEEIV
ncbi:unnamed protein product [Ixodes persulcatus]